MKEKSEVVKTVYEQIVRCHAFAKADCKQLYNLKTQFYFYLVTSAVLKQGKCAYGINIVKNVSFGTF